MSNLLVLRRYRLSLCLLGLVVLFSVRMTAHAQNVTDVYITPSNGIPGTVVTLINTNAAFSFQCFANGIDLGYVNPSSILNYTVPADAAPGSSIDFRCYITSVDTTDSVGVFLVDAPLPVDSDGDGVPDNSDACPKEFAQTPNGCPPPPPTTPDSDGDGVPDNADACPQQFAQTQNGCPPTPTAIQQAQPTIPPTFELFPSDSVCTVSPAANSAVNVREAPSSDAPIVAQLTPGTGATVLLMTNDRTWVQIAAGWVSTAVTQLTGDCSTVPLISYQTTVIATPQAPASYDWRELLSACPELLEQAESLSFQAILRLISTNASDQRCVIVRSYLREGLYRRYAIPPETWITPASTCWGAVGLGAIGREAAAAYNGFRRALIHIDPEFYDRYFRWQPDRIRTWASTEDDFCNVMRLNRPRIADLTLRAGMTNNQLITIAVTSCPSATTLPSERLRITIIQLIRAGFQGDQLLRDPEVCNLINEVHLLGTLSEPEIALFGILVQTCQFTRYRQPIPYRLFSDAGTEEMSAANIVGLAIRYAADLEGLFQVRLDRQFCEQPLDILSSWRVPDARQRTAAAEETSADRYTPRPFRECPYIWQRIVRRNADLTPAEILSLLRNANPCSTALDWLNGSAPIPLNVGAARTCITGLIMAVPAGTTPANPNSLRYGGDLPPTTDAPVGSVVLPIGVITRSTSWAMKLWVVDRDVESICRIEYAVIDERLVIGSPTPPISLSDPSLISIDLSSIDPASLMPISTYTATPTPAPLPGGSSASPTPTPAPGGSFATNTPLPPASDSAPGGTAVAVAPPASADNAIEDARAVMREILEAPSLTTGALGVFEAARLGSENHDLYLLMPHGVTALTVDSPANERVPVLDADGQRVAYLSSTDGITSIHMIDIHTGVITVLFTATSELTPYIIAPAWSPIAPILLVTLGDATGIPSIYAIDVSDPAHIPPPTLLISNGRSPAITADGMFIAFAQGTESRSDIVVMDLSSGTHFPLAGQSDGIMCDNPAFDETGITLYFDCLDTVTTNATTTYRYGLDGMLMVPVGGELIGRFDAGPTLNALTFNTGSAILLQEFSEADGTINFMGEMPLVELEGFMVNNFRWRTYRLATTS